MRFVTGRLIFGGAGTLVINQAIISALEVTAMEYEVELPPVIEVELPEPAVIDLPETPEIET